MFWPPENRGLFKNLKKMKKIKKYKIFILAENDEYSSYSYRTLKEWSLMKFDTEDEAREYVESKKIKLDFYVLPYYEYY